MNGSIKFSKKISALGFVILSAWMMVALPTLALTSCADSDGAIHTPLPDNAKSHDPATQSLDDAAWEMELQATTKTVTCTDGNLIEVAVSSRKTGDREKSPFEVFWFMDGKALGLNRKANLALPPSQNVSIKVGDAQASCASADESRAFGGTILRVVLSLLLNHDNVTYVILPDANYSAIASEMQSRRGILLPAGEHAPSSAKVKFELRSASGRIKQEMYFQ